MFKKYSSYLLAILLISTLVGCSSTNPLIKETQDHIKNKDMQGALASSKKLITEEPGNPLGYYFKGTVLGDIAQNKEKPADGETYYKKMNESFDKSQSIADTLNEVPEKVKGIHAVKTSFWRNELNTGVQIAQSDSLQNTMDNAMQKSMQHVKNATIILPEKALSWKALSQIAQVNKSYDQAAKAKEKHFEVAADSSISANDYLLLGSFYYQQDKQEKVVEAFEKGFKKFPKNEKLASNLADAYSRTGESEKAISTTRKLVEKYPENARYRLVYGTQLYKKSRDMAESVSSNVQQIKELEGSKGADTGAANSKIEKLKKENANLNTEISDLVEKSVTNYKKCLSLDSQNEEALKNLGIVYKNRAKRKYVQRNMTADNAKAKKLDDEAKELLKESMKYYEKAVEIDPDNKSHWRNLFQIYARLGMDKKVKKAKKKAGIK